MSEEVENVPQDVPQGEPAAQPDNETEVTGTTEAAEGGDHEQEQQTEDPKPKNGWVQKRLGQLAHQRNVERERAERAETALRMVQGNGGNAAQPQAMDATVVERRAREIADSRALASKIDSVVQAGQKEYADFDERCDTFMNGFGAAERTDILPILAELDSPHKVIAALTDDPELAHRILAMPTAKMAIELDRLSQKTTKPVVKQISKAPTPPSPISGKGGTTSADPFKAESVEEYVKRRNAQGGKR